MVLVRYMLLTILTSSLRKIVEVLIVLYKVVFPMFLFRCEWTLLV